MVTVQDIVSRALRLLRVLDAHEAPEAQQMADAIFSLNAMMRRWEADGIALGWSPVDNPADVAPLPPEAEEAVAYNLALRLRAEYGASLDPDVIGIAQQGMAALKRDVLVAAPLRLAARSPRAGHYNIYTDEWT